MTMEDITNEVKADRGNAKSGNWHERYCFGTDTKELPQSNYKRIFHRKQNSTLYFRRIDVRISWSFITPKIFEISRLLHQSRSDTGRNWNQIVKVFSHCKSWFNSRPKRQQDFRTCWRMWGRFYNYGKYKRLYFFKL
jgi:hypothetical protein